MDRSLRAMRGNPAPEGVRAAAAARTFRPSAHALALEPRILFDAAAATAAVEHQQQQDDGAAVPADDVSTPATAEPAPRQLVVLDGEVAGPGRLVDDLPDDVYLLTVRAGDDALGAISRALNELGRVDSIQIFSHGSAGQFSLGDDTFTAGSLRAAAGELASWRLALTAGADIQLYGCSVGAGESGRALVNEIARWTGADVGASDDDTGSASRGGDWRLEVTAGNVDRALALSPAAVADFDALLPATVSLAAGADVSIGSTFTFTVTFRNSALPIGYGPFVDLAFPVTGRDGDDGVTFVSASYLGTTIRSYTMTFDAAGNATHPLARDSSGQAVVVNAATFGARPGDQFVVVQLPFSGVSPDNVPIDVQITASLSDLADTTFSDATPDLTIAARGGFQFGNDSLDNPASDPSQFEAALHPFVVHPVVISMSQSVNVTEGETVSGPNYPHVQTLTLTPAPGQSLQDVRVTQPLPENAQVTAITPGAGGTLVSITLHDGTVVLGAGAQIVLASGTALIDSYTLEYPTLTGEVSSQVRFYVPEIDHAGAAVIDPASGADITVTFGAPTVEARFQPRDTRDLPLSGTSVVTGNGTPVSFTASSISLHKEVSLSLDIGGTGITPGDVLDYSLNIDVSDYFAFGENLLQEGELTIVDQLSDGQTLTGTPTMRIDHAGTAHTVALVYTSTANADGTTTITFDLSASIRAYTTTQGPLPGDLAFDDLLQGATRAVIAYSALVSQAYTAAYAQSALNEGDQIGNSATVTGSVLLSRISLSGSSVSDGSSTTSTIDANNIDIEIVTVNGNAAGSIIELRPGDMVTFQLAYDLATGDFEQFSLSASLPLPLLDVSGITWTLGSDHGQWSVGPGNTTPTTSVIVSSAAGNSVLFSLGNFTDVTARRIEVQFTLRVGDQPFADQRALAVTAESRQVTTINASPLVSVDAEAINSVAEPLLAMSHGVVAATNGTVSGTTGTWNAPGTSGIPFGGSVTDLTAIAGAVTGIDGGDLVRLATAIENRGGGAAFDTTTIVTLPAGLAFVGGSLGSANLLVYRGDGSVLSAGTDYSVTGNTITFLDVGSIGTLSPGRAGTAADTSGANIVIITYDAVVDDAIAAASTLQSSAALTRYASAEGGIDFTGDDLVDQADQQVASPAIAKDFADGSLTENDSSAAHTTGSNLVVGERMRYDIIVTLPEGTTQTLRVEDLVPAGMRLDTSFNGGAGYQVITTAAGSGALSADFNGTVTAGPFAGLSGGTPGNDGVGFSLAFTASSAAADNNVANNVFVIRLQLIASNVAANQANATRQNSARTIFSDPDGDTANGSVALDRTLALTNGAPTITLREPTLQVTQTATYPRPIGVDTGDTVEYEIVIRNGAGSGDVNAFDISFLDNLPAPLGQLSLVSVTYAGGATNNGGVDFEIVGNQLRTVAGANVDVTRGGTITLRVTGVIQPNLAQLSLVNTASVQWTSLDGADAGERTGVDGALNSGSLNDYRASATNTVPVAAGIRFSRVGGLPDTAAPQPTDAASERVTIGEIVRYRVVALVPEATAPGYNLQLTLSPGLGFLNDGTVRLVFISTNGISTSLADLISAGTLNLVGNENSPEALAISADLSGAAPTGVMNPSHISVTTDGSGNTVATFNLGTLLNPDDDFDLEGVSLEFNAVVLNDAANINGRVLNASVVDRSDSTPLTPGAALSEVIDEPAFSGLDKRVVGFDSNPSGVVGTATVSVAFTQSGTLAAFDTRLTDSFAGGVNYVIQSVEIGGTSYAPGNLPAGVSVSTAGGVTVDFARLEVGTQVRVLYQVTVPNQAPIAPGNATLTWSSLPESFTSWGGSGVNADGTAGGERTGTGVSPNTYLLTEGAGLGEISGRLWDDTATADSSTNPDGPALAGQTVTLTWAGLDGNLSTTTDNLVFTTTTNASGDYQFGVLPAGIFRIDTPAGTITYPQPIGDLRVRIDTDGSTLAQIVVTLGEGVESFANAGYVQQNDAPVNTLPGPQAGTEDLPLALAPLSIADVDVAAGTLDITLSVLHGTLALSGTPGGVTVAGAGTATLQLSGTLAALNQALALLVYQGNLNFNGADTLTINTRDRGGTGDADNDGTPGENPGDQLSDIDSLPITLAAVNDPPAANDDSAAAQEAGGVANGSPGIDPRGDVLENDTDVDLATNAEVLRVVSASSSVTATTAVPPGGSAAIVSQYGTLFIRSNGGYQYVVDNDNAVVQALRLTGQTLAENFQYTLSDLAGVTDTATLSVTITGANDAPVAGDDAGTAIEAGGVANGSGGSPATGDVLANDTDVDSPANGESRSVTAVRSGDADSTGAPTLVPAGSNSTNGAVVAGLYGTLTLGADGTYRYIVDDANEAVQRMIAGDTLTDVFSYQVKDALGLGDIANLVITLNGSNDNPVAIDDAANAQAASTNDPALEVNPRGNVIQFPSAGGPDSDVDRADQPNTQLAVNGIRTGAEGAGGALTAVAAGTTSANGTVLAGLYGTLTIGADGSAFYDVDSENAAVIALPAGTSLTETFTYQITDTAGLSDVAQITITVYGVNDPPIAEPNFALAVEAGGVANNIPGTDPAGDALTRDTDPDGNPLSVVAIRTGPLAGTGQVGTVGQALAGAYGSLTINANGTYSYTLANGNAAVEALRRPGDQLLDRFTYTISDGLGQFSSAEIVVIISGRNDNPVAADDASVAVEAGGIDNLTPGTPATGNVLANDNDVDQFNETEAVSSLRTGTEAGSGTAGTVGTELRGQYGWLTLNADGSYSYRLDETDPAVEALRTSADTLTENFSYTVADAAGAEDRATLTITIRGANDSRNPGNDTALAIEAGGSNNLIAGVDPTGNVLANDVDVDFGDVLTVTGVRQGGRAVAAGTALVANYGTLTLNADGSFSYVLDNLDPRVQALRLPTETLTEDFTYAVRDLAGASRLASLTIVISGRNDTPVANTVGAVAVEAGESFNSQPGVNSFGNLLANDSDVDGGEERVVIGLRLGLLNSGPIPTNPTTVTTIAGSYGTLTVNADGTFSYVVDNTLAVVEALRPGDALTDTFTYLMRDRAGEGAVAELRVIIHGVWDTPVAQDNVAMTGANNLDPVEGGVLDNDSDVDRDEVLVVSGIRLGTESAGGGLAAVTADTNGTNGTAVQGLYGTLIIGADGTYEYRVDPANATLLALGPLQVINEVFTYQTRDAGARTDLAQLTIMIRGRNEAPIVQNDTGAAVEAGGVGNTQPGVNPSGNVLANDSDLDNELLAVVDIRTGALAAGGTAGTIGTGLRGLYGTLTMNLDGSWIYEVDNTLPEVEALRISGQTLQEVFTYTARDIWNGRTDGELTITLDGRDDTPVALDDAGTAVEAGGVFNDIPGADAVGDVLVNDSDVDSAAYGEMLRVVDYSHANGGIAAAGAALAGQYGQLTVGADGSYRYVIDNANPLVQALRTAGQTLTDTFTYRVSDVFGLMTTATLQITLQGADDTPVAMNDAGIAVESGGIANGTAGSDAAGSVLANDSDADSAANGELLEVIDFTDVNGVTTAAGEVFTGLYGQLTIAADGSYRYVIDNANPLVQALRTAEQTLTEIFTYRVTDVSGAITTARLQITIQGADDTPVALDNAAVAVEAGGTFNGTPGSDATGSVLDNDSDVDAASNGEVLRVVDYSRAGGASVSAGASLAGLYGQLTIFADGSYRYVIDNANPQVQVMRTAAETLTEVFTYRISDATGAISTARLTITLQGANDSPVAVNDTSPEATDQVVAPQTRGFVLRNDSDIDGGDALRVVGIRAGNEAAGGVAGPVGQPVAGRYGTLLIQADGSYTYTIDLTNPEVLAAAGLGQLLTDVFTYTLADLAGGTDLAELFIPLRISAPYIPLEGGNILTRGQMTPPRGLLDLDFDPVVFVAPIVERDALINLVTAHEADGGDIGLYFDRGIQSQTLRATLGHTPGQHVHDAVRDSQLRSELDLARILGRQERIDLSADRLLPSPSVFSVGPGDLQSPPAGGEPPAAAVATSFTSQLQAAARQRSPDADGVH